MKHVILKHSIWDILASNRGLTIGFTLIALIDAFGFFVVIFMLYGRN
jgi:hypothetical protein